MSEVRLVEQPPIEPVITQLPARHVIVLPRVPVGLQWLVLGLFVGSLVGLGGMLIPWNFAQTQIAKGNGTISSLIVERDRIGGELDKANATIDSQGAKLAAFDAQVKDLQGQLGQSRADADGAKKDLAAASAQVGDLKSQLTSMAGRLEDANSRAASADSRANAAASRPPVVVQQQAATPQRSSIEGAVSCVIGLTRLTTAGCR